jgi:hypothetical protein
MTLNDLQDNIQTLQPKQACAVDGILNEMVKYADNKFQLAILKLFNIILSSGIFPNIWNQRLITPIHKVGYTPTLVKSSALSEDSHLHYH